MRKQAVIDMIEAGEMSESNTGSGKAGRAKSTGIIRRVDELGRIVIPMSIRQTLGLNERDPVEIYVNGERIILQKHQASCIFCGCTESLIVFEGKNICDGCLSSIRKQF